MQVQLIQYIIYYYITELEKNSNRINSITIQLLNVAAALL